MSGVKGKSGGPRPNSGGKRPGAGRKPAPSQPVTSGDKDMLQLLQDIALGRIEVSPTQVKAAIAAVQYTHHKKGEGGKKEGQQEAAKKAAGKFSAPAPPRLVVNNK